MYIIEKIIKLILKAKKKNNNIQVQSYEDNAELEDILTCQHNFMPIDSTGNVLACSKCGYLINKSRIKQQKN